MSPRKFVGILLVAAGVFGLLYGGFSYTKKTHDVKLGPVELSLKEKGSFNVAVCAGVGDFSDYIVDGVNGFLLPIEGTEGAIEAVIRKAYADKTALPSLGRKLREDVLGRFSVREETVDQYEALLR